MTSKVFFYWWGIGFFERPILYFILCRITINTFLKRIPNKHKTLTHCRFDVGPSSWRRPNIKPTVGQRLVFAGILSQDPTSGTLSWHCSCSGPAAPCPPLGHVNKSWWFWCLLTLAFTRELSLLSATTSLTRHGGHRASHQLSGCRRAT